MIVCERFSFPRKEPHMLVGLELRPPNIVTFLYLAASGRAAQKQLNYRSAALVFFPQL